MIFKGSYEETEARIARLAQYVNQLEKRIEKLEDIAGSIE